MSQNPFTFVEPIHGNNSFEDKLRKDLIDRLNEAWTPGNFQPVLIHGQRQIGKTSLIFLARSRLDIEIIYVNLRHLGTNATYSQLLWAICDELNKIRYIFPKLTYKELITNAYHEFQSYVRRVCRDLDARRMVIVLDEFDHLESILQFSYNQNNLLEFLWEISQTERELGFAFITATTRVEIYNYFENSFGAGLHSIKVEYLSLEEAKTVLQDPHEDFLPFFTDSACEKIHLLSGGHPYLIQMLAYSVVDKFIEAIGQSSSKSDPVFTDGDVGDVLDDEDFKMRWLRYYDNISNEVLDKDDLPIYILHRIACSADGFSKVELERIQTNENNEASENLVKRHLDDALRILYDHGVIILNKNNKHFKIPVELTRRELRYPETPPNRQLPKENTFQILIHERQGNDKILARASLWLEISSDFVDFRCLMSDLNADDLMVFTQLCELAQELLLQKKTQLNNRDCGLFLGLADRYTFWNIRFGEYEFREFPAYFRPRNNFKSFIEFESYDIDLLSTKFLEIQYYKEQLLLLNLEVYDIDEIGISYISDIILELTIMSFSNVPWCNTEETAISAFSPDPLFTQLSSNAFRSMFAAARTKDKLRFVFVVKESDTPVGFVWAKPKIDTKTGAESDTLLLKTVAVAPSFRGNNIGTILVQWTAKHAQMQGFRTVKLEYVPSYASDSMWHRKLNNLIKKSYPDCYEAKGGRIYRRDI